MEKNRKRILAAGIALLLAFALWTILVMKEDVQQVEIRPVQVTRDISGAEPETVSIGLAGMNTAFHKLTGEHMKIYTVTDWLGLVPILICACFGVLGLVQLIKRKSLLKVDRDIILLGVYYILVILAYLAFEKFKVNYRPVKIDGVKEASYPSSTTLLVLSVMPTLIFQANRRIRNTSLRRALVIFAVLFAAFMVIGRTVSGVHWLSDIIGGILPAAGLYLLYRASVMTPKAEGSREN